LLSKIVNGIGAYSITSVRSGFIGMLIVCTNWNVRVGELVGTSTAMFAAMHPGVRDSVVGTLGAGHTNACPTQARLLVASNGRDTQYST
jgi:hypothetical protein